MLLTYCIRAAVIAMVCANASIFLIERGKPKWGALIASNLLCFVIAGLFLLMIASGS